MGQPVAIRLLLLGHQPGLRVFQAIPGQVGVSPANLLFPGFDVQGRISEYCPTLLRHQSQVREETKIFKTGITELVREAAGLLS